MASALGAGGMRSKRSRCLIAALGREPVRRSSAYRRDFQLATQLELCSDRAGCYCAVASDDVFAKHVRGLLADRLLRLLEVLRKPEWEWFEDSLAYDMRACRKHLSLRALQPGRARTCRPDCVRCAGSCAFRLHRAASSGR